MDTGTGDQLRGRLPPLAVTRPHRSYLPFGVRRRGDLACCRMAAVVNYLHFKEPVDPSVFARSERDLVPQMRAIEGFRGFEVVQTSERDVILVILVILGESVEVLDQIATEVGSPWMKNNVVPLLDGPPQRHIGPSIASSGA
jgi:hypothetical protein